MSLINLFIAARNAFARWREQQRAYAELIALDDRSLADIGIHRSQIPALIEGFGQLRGAELPAAMAAPMLGPRIAGQRSLPQV